MLMLHILTIRIVSGLLDRACVFCRDNHGKGWECAHYCHPSAPQLWTYHLYEKIKVFAPAEAILPERWHPSRHPKHQLQLDRL